MSNLIDISQVVTFTLNERELRFRKFTLRTLSEFVSISKRRHIESVLAALGPNATSEERIQVTLAVSRDMDHSNDLDLLESLENVALALWLCLRDEQPDLTEEEVGDLVTLDSMPELTDFIQSSLLPQGKGNPKN